MHGVWTVPFIPDMTCSPALMQAPTKPLHRACGLPEFGQSIKISNQLQLYQSHWQCIYNLSKCFQYTKAFTHHAFQSRNPISVVCHTGYISQSTHGQTEISCKGGVSRLSVLSQQPICSYELLIVLFIVYTSYMHIQ